MAFIDARTLPNGTEIEADLIIIGGGMAGIAIAKEWAGLNKRIAILESGGREFDEDTQDLYRGSGTLSAPDNADQNVDDYLHQSRFRALGGSGNIWGGKCVPLDPSDFARRDWLPLTGWPVTRDGLKSYYDRACALLEIEPFDRDWDAEAEDGRPPFRINGDYFSAPRRHTMISGGGDAERFDAFRTGFADAANISVYLHANVTELRARRFPRALRGLTVACLDGKRHSARARTYVLATGGIENARLMLASDIGNSSDLVGRCFQGHMNFGVFDAPEGRNSSMCVSDPASNLTLYTSNGRDVTHCVLVSTLEGQRRQRTLNFTVTMFEESAPLTPDVEALTRLVGALDQDAAGPPARNLTCYFKTEQLPNPESRIVLDSANADALGMARVKLEWNFTALDLDLLGRSIAGFADALGAEGVGRVCWPLRRNQFVSVMTPARHHMGTTRIDAHADAGVVDNDCRVHDVPNLYIAGSSVFPTCGNANPTLTLLALAYRLSDHLKQRLGARA